MPHRICFWVTLTLLVTAAFLLPTSDVLAGEHVRAATRSPTPPQPVPITVARVSPQPVTFVVAPVAVSIAITQPAGVVPEEAYVDLRSPDGQRRTFTVEGGPSAIRTLPVLVLRPGQSLTIRLAAK